MAHYTEEQLINFYRRIYECISKSQDDYGLLDELNKNATEFMTNVATYKWDRNYEKRLNNDKVIKTLVRIKSFLSKIGEEDLSGKMDDEEFALGMAANSVRELMERRK